LLIRACCCSGEVGWIRVRLIIHLVFLLGVMSASGLTPSSLRCEFQVDPLGVDAPQPRWSWHLESGQRGDAQSAYQILVGSTAAALAADAGDS
jgi:alpha-L-rhamnosidase